MSRKIDEDGRPGRDGHIVETDRGTDREAVVFRLPLRLPFSRGRQRWLVIRWRERIGNGTLSVE